MSQSTENDPRRTPRSPLSGRILIAALLATTAAASACERGQPTGPDRAAPERPSLALNPACDPGLGGQTHTDSILVSTTWGPAGNPHRVDQLIHIEGAAWLRLDPGTLVCFGSGGGLRAHNGGRVRVLGSAAAPVVLTATDPANGWLGVHLAGTPAASSVIDHLRLEHTRGAFAFATYDDHTASIDSSLFRQNEMGLYLWGYDTRMRRSQVDTVTDWVWPAVTLGRKTSFRQNVVRGAAGVGLSVLGTDSVLLGSGLVEGSGRVGLHVTTPGSGLLGIAQVRVTGGATYPAEMDVSAFARIYWAISHADSLLGNARDTVVITGGALTETAHASPTLPWRVTGEVAVEGNGILRAHPGATIFFGPFGQVTATSPGRVIARGTQAAPVLFTGGNWEGLHFHAPVQGQSTPTSYLTNVRVEGASFYAVRALSPHPVVIDSAVFRQNGIAVSLEGPSRLSRSRVDTTLMSFGHAVGLSSNSVMESTLIRGSAGVGLRLYAGTAQILSCEIRESAAEGIVTYGVGSVVQNCNLVNNGGVGIQALNFNGVIAEDNWWGDAAGPTGPNGDGVSDYVDYTPWRTTPYVLPYVP
ncbi:MAG TPA: right-handed parallel beta-helix repeat-containing protein [Longimicrobium sp.]